MLFNFERMLAKMNNRYLRLFITLIFDGAIADVSLLLAMLISGESINFDIVYSIIILPILLIVFFYVFKVYNILWRYSGYNELARIAAGSAMAVSGVYVVLMALFSKACAVSTYIITFLFVCLLISAERILLKKIYISSNMMTAEDNDSTLKGNVMLIGGGDAGSTIINEVVKSKKMRDCKIRCVIDDDHYKIGKYISGVKIVGDRNMIIEAAKKYEISIIVFAIPSCPSDEKSEILNICQKTGCSLRTVPAIYQLLDNKFGVSVIRNVKIEDLLGRNPIKINLDSIMNYVENKVVMVTGGGGSIGSELCRQIAVHNPKQLIIFDVYENNAYDIQNELLRKYPKLNLVTLIGSVRDSKRLDCVFAKYHPQIVYHAAAHKHVPLMEESPNEAIKNNVFGTYKTAQFADKYGVQKFILISTDKAVNPTNIMGATKRICEMIVQYFNNHSDTEYVAVRFGNVLGSNGSVIPVFKKEIENGGPVTVTDPEIIRYFMTIPEAVSLVLQAGASAKGGEIFVLDMGKPVKILTLAENLIRLSGYKPYEDIEIKFTGLRKGEKLYEELLMSEEGLQNTENELIHIGKPIDIDEKVFIDTLNKMQNIMYDDGADVRELVKLIVPTYNYVNESANSVN